jgi:hypothetical protein
LRDDDAIPCQHLNFASTVGIARLANEDQPLRFMAEIRIRCADCDQPFMFEAIADIGFRFDASSIDVSGQQLTTPVAPWDGRIATNANYQMRRPE